MRDPNDLLDALPDEPVLRELKPAANIDLIVAEAKRVILYLRLHPGQTLEDALTPDFWKLTAHRLHPSTIVEIEPLDLSWHAQVLVREVSREHAKVALLHKVDLPPLYPPNTDDLPLGYHISFLGSSRLWAVLHGTAILKHSFSDKGSAVQWLQESLR